MAKTYKSYDEKAHTIIKDNNYMSLASSSKEGKPWVVAVFYSCDKDYNFYFLSAVDSKHAKQMLANPNVAFVIFDSGQKIGESDAVEVEGVVSVVGEDEIKKVIEVYVKKLFPSSDMPPTTRYNPSEYIEPSEFRFFKIKPGKMYTTGEDRRTEVDLKK